MGAVLGASSPNRQRAGKVFKTIRRDQVILDFSATSNLAHDEGIAERDVDSTKVRFVARHVENFLDLVPSPQCGS